MSDGRFETFARVIDSFPPKVVFKAAARERYILEEDLSLGRAQPNKDVVSILAFCRFLEGAVRGQTVLPQGLSMEHWTFCLKTVARLVAAEELPRNVKEEIEAAFHEVFCCIMG